MKNNLFNLPLEMQLLLACCRLSMEQDDQERTKNLNQLSVLTRRAMEAWGGEWSTFINLIDRHRVDSFVYHNICHYATEQPSHQTLEIPADVYLVLKTRSHDKKRQMLKLTAELVRLSKLFAQHDIFMLSFKGPALSQQLFGDLGLRYSKDLDLLIKPQDLDRAEQLLLSNGYTRQLPDFVLTPRQKKAYLKYRQHVSYYHHGRQTLVEVHWRLCSNPHFLSPEYAEQMIETTQQVTIAGTQMTSLSDEDTLLYLCLHGANHGWYRLKWLCDVAQFLHREHREQTINWQAWVENVIRLSLHRPVAQALLLAHHLFDAPLPPATHPLTAENQIVPQLVTHAIQMLMLSKEELFAVGRLNAFRHLSYRMKLKADLRYQWSDFSRIWYFVNDWKTYPLPDVLFPLYYILGPFSWLRRKFSL